MDSKLLCKYKKLESAESVAIPHSFLSSRLEPRLGQLTSQFGLNDIHCLSTFKIQRLRAYKRLICWTSTVSIVDISTTLLCPP